MRARDPGSGARRDLAGMDPGTRLAEGADMAIVVFYEKPGCAGNARQKEILLRAGHTLEVRDLLSHPWSAEELSRFLMDVPVAEWFHRTAPRVKSGEVVPEALTAEQALPLLLADPVLIRRPLLQVGERREVGFILSVVDRWIGAEPLEPASSCGGPEGCGGTSRLGGRSGAAPLTTLRRKV
jgi:nitrogenase-associated protein